MNIKCVLMIVWALLWSISLYSQTSYSQTDTAALRAIDRNCDGNDSLNWNSEPNPGNWYWVVWNSDNPKRVTRIDVTEKGLTGYMDASQLTRLEYLNCSSNNLTRLKVTDLVNLQTLYCYNNQLNTLDASNLTRLKYLICRNNNLTSLNVLNLPSIHAIECDENQLSSLDVADLTSLTSLHCQRNYLTNLDVNNLVDLDGLSCSENELDSLNISKLTKLISLSCSDNHIRSLDISELTELTTLRCYGNKMPFSELFGGFKIENYYYNPQDTIFDPINVSGTYEMDYSAEAIFADSVTQFYLLKRNSNVWSEIGFNNNGMFTIAEPGQYCCRMSNGWFPHCYIYTAKVSITGSLLVSDSSLILSSASDSKATFDITSNISWEITASDTWFNFSPSLGSGNNTVTVTATSENTTENSRTATLTITGAGASSQTVTILQESQNATVVPYVNSNNTMIYPNPLVDFIHIELDEEELPATLSVFDLSGECIRRNEIHQTSTEVDLSVLQPGVYLMQIVSPAQSIGRKIIKQ